MNECWKKELVVYFKSDFGLSQKEMIRCGFLIVLIEM